MVIGRNRRNGSVFWGCGEFSTGVCQVTMEYTRPGQNETTRTDTPEHNNEDETEDDADDWNLQPESSNEDEALIRELENMRRRGKNPVHHRIG
jgi:hypothetical protein